MLKKEGILPRTSGKFMGNAENDRREKMHDISSGEKQRRADRGLLIRPKGKKKRYAESNMYIR